MRENIEAFMKAYAKFDENGVGTTYFKIEIGIGNNDIVIVADNEINGDGGMYLFNLRQNYTGDDVEEIYGMYDGDLKKYITIID